MVRRMFQTIGQIILGVIRPFLLFGIAAEVFYKPMDYDTDY